jgi:hypothetical protein
VYNGADISTDSKVYQAWTSKEDAFKKWGMLLKNVYWRKILKAVNETKGLKTG